MRQSAILWHVECFLQEEKRVVSLLAVGGKIGENLAEERGTSPNHGREATNNHWIVLFERSL
jgi:hypothetical protein